MNKINTTKIFNYMKQNNLNKKQMAERCDISVYTLNKILKGEINIGISKIFKALITINATMKDLLGA